MNLTSKLIYSFENILKTNMTFQMNFTIEDNYLFAIETIREELVKQLTNISKNKITENIISITFDEIPEHNNLESELQTIWAELDNQIFTKEELLTNQHWDPSEVIIEEET